MAEIDVAEIDRDLLGVGLPGRHLRGSWPSTIAIHHRDHPVTIRNGMAYGRSAFFALQYGASCIAASCDRRRGTDGNRAGPDRFGVLRRDRPRRYTRTRSRRDLEAGPRKTVVAERAPPRSGGSGCRSGHRRGRLAAGRTPPPGPAVAPLPPFFRGRGWSACRRATRHRPPPGSARRGAPRAWCAGCCRCRSGCRGRRDCWPPPGACAGPWAACRPRPPAGLAGAPPPEPRVFHVEEADVEGRVVDDEAPVGEEGQEFAHDVGEGRLVGQERVGQAVDVERALGDGALRVAVAVEGPARRDVVEELHRADLDQPVAPLRLGAGGLGVEDDLAQHGSRGSQMGGGSYPDRPAWLSSRAPQRELLR